ncbi:hypothetical protein EEL33_01265 [Muribaculaceae bacterium Isolate-037 (Harlan)]|nr:hypothetical protein EEL33_01265 [Muribaculaceae bacterium Isolate-037 (Harlan)]
MKHFGSIVDFTRQRNADIMRVFRQKIVEADVIRMDDICKAVAESPSCRFWVSEKRAAIVISSMESGRCLPCMTETKREMFAEIYRRYKELRLIHPKMTILELATIVVNQPAPKFYFTPRTVREIVRRIRNGYYDRKHNSIKADGFSKGSEGSVCPDSKPSERE